MNKKIIGIIVIILFVGTILPTTGSIIIDKIPLSIKNGNTLYVGGRGPNNYTKIQDAINNAFNGDTVFVYDDKSPYPGSLVIDKSINLIGENKNTTFILGSIIKQDVIAVFSDNVQICGFTIQQTRVGVHVYNQSNVIIKENIIQINSWNGIWIEKSTNCEVINNIIQDNDKGVYIQESKNCNIVNNFIGFNRWDGIHIILSSDILIGKNDIFNNFYDGIILSTSNNNSIYKNNIINNSCGIFIEYSSLNKISENIISKHSKNGIYIFHKDTYNSSLNQILKNYISYNNCGIILYSSDNIIKYNNFIGNNIHATFWNSKNIWDKNFWQHPHIFLYLIFGKIFFRNILLTWFNIDWSPAKEPYDI